MGKMVFIIIIIIIICINDDNSMVLNMILQIREDTLEDIEPISFLQNLEENNFITKKKSNKLKNTELKLKRRKIEIEKI